MILINEKVEHISYGFGVVTKEAGNKISVQFQQDIGSKTFLYPDAFEKFLKAVDPKIESGVLDELHAKQEQLMIELLERERKTAELEEKRLKTTSTKKRTTRAVKQKV